MDKYLPGKVMPCDYASCHAAPIEDLMEEEGAEWSDQGHDFVVGTSVKGGGRRAESNTSSSRSTTSVRHTMVKRRRPSGRQDDVMERHRHWSVSGLAGTGAQRVGAREAAPRYDETRMQLQDGGSERNDDGDADTDADAEDGADADQDGAAAAEGGQVQEGARPDIQARLRRAPRVIVTETWANRAQRTRVPRDIFEAGTKKVVKRPGRGWGDR